MLLRSVRVLRPSATISLRSFGTEGNVPAGSPGFRTRERASETKAMQDRDRELLEKLKAKLRAEKGTDSAHHAEVIERLQKAIHEVALPKDVVDAAKDEPITADDLIVLRKEMVNKMRQLEDELAALKLKR